MKANQLRTIAGTLNATVTDRRKITALVTGIRNYAESVTPGTEAEAIGKLNEAVTLATGYGADQAFISMLKSQIKALKKIVKSAKVSVEFEGFRLPYTFVKGTATLSGSVYPFLCYFNAPSLANPARSIDPTFDKSVSIETKAKLREAVKTALVKAWDGYRTERTALAA